MVIGHSEWEIVVISAKELRAWHNLRRPLKSSLSVDPLFPRISAFSLYNVNLIRMLIIKLKGTVSPDLICLKVVRFIRPR